MIGWKGAVCEVRVVVIPSLTISLSIVSVGETIVLGDWRCGGALELKPLLDV